MTRRYLIYLSAPLLLLIIILVETMVALLIDPKLQVGFVHMGGERRSTLLIQAARAGRGASLAHRSVDEALTRPGLVVYDQALTPRYVDPPAGGSPYADLETLKDLAYSGSTVVLGFAALSDTESPEARQDLLEASGARDTGWRGAYVTELGSTGSVPARVREAWERANGRPWDLRHGGLLLYRPAEGRVIVLLRGAELGLGALRVEGASPPGREAAARMHGYYSGWFAVLANGPETRSDVDFVVDTTSRGKEILAAAGLPSRFPAFLSRPYGSGSLWTEAGDFDNAEVASESVGPLPLPTVESARTLDAPQNSLAQFHRILVPLVFRLVLASPQEKRGVGAVTAPPQPGRSVEFRSGRRYLEVRLPGGDWKPWFAQGVDLGASLPGTWATEPSLRDEYYYETFRKMAASGFNCLRVYTLLPPAFYRALARFNRSGQGPLYLFQGIWLDENPPGHDLLDPTWLQAAKEEFLLGVDALHGRASIPPRKEKSWGDYRVDVSPWIAAFLVGRELLPEEAVATVAAHPRAAFAGSYFNVDPGHPMEAFLAELAEVIQAREGEKYNAHRPIGFVSWPTLDPLHHPGAWDAHSALPPYQDLASVDLRLIHRRAAEEAGFFAAFHIYPNYPDFMVREAAYASDDPTGMTRYGAYLTDLMSVLPPVPLIVAEFGLATGYGTAHLHPEGLNHGGLTETAQAEGISRLFRTIASRGGGGGMVFEWSDEWSKKTWTTEPYMIPYARHDLWHNTVDPEQNYGILAWTPGGEPRWRTIGEGLRAAEDSEYLRIRLGTGLVGTGTRIIEVGIDTVPGETGQRRLATDGPLCPQGSEFKLWLKVEAGRPVAARLLVAADYDKYAGLLWPASSSRSNFAVSYNLVNATLDTQEGLSFPALYEDESILPLDQGRNRGLVSLIETGEVEVRLPWGRLNFSDPSSRRILLDPRPNPLGGSGGTDALSTVEIADLGFCVYLRDAPTAAPRLALGADVSARMPLEDWNTVAFEARPKLALGSLAALLSTWRPLPGEP